MPLDPDMELLDVEGEPVRLGDIEFERFLVVQLVRYFGCLPCQDWLIALDALQPEFAGLGARPAAVGASADHQARWLRDKREVTIPLLLEHDHQFREAVDMSKPLGVRMADPRGIGAYIASLLHGNRPQAITADTIRTPGVVVLDRDYEVRWRHEGTRIGDYPDHMDVLRVLRGLH